MPPAPPLPSPDPVLQRTTGALRLGFVAGPHGSRIHTFFQEGAARARMPKVPAGAPPEAVLINTAGGLTGGDRLSTEVRMAAGSQATITSQASEKIYKASSGETRIVNRIRVEGNGRLEWLPQEAILFDRARLDRTLDVEADDAASVLLAEAVVFGRTAMGESVRTGTLRDRWRIRRGGRLVFADAFVLDGERAGVGRPAAGAPTDDGRAARILARPTALAGGCAMATVLQVAAEVDGRLQAVRAVLGAALDGCEGAVDAGASAWDGLLAVRMVAADGAALRRVLVPVLEALRDDRPLPTVWHC